MPQHHPSRENRPASAGLGKGWVAVAAVVALGFDLLEESLGGSAVVFDPERIGFECLLQYFVERTELVESGLPLVHRLVGFGGSDPLSDSVSGQPGTLRYLVKRKLVAEVHPPNFSHHFHADHLVFSCSESEQKQLNTWVSFQSAEQPLMGQFSVSGNTSGRFTANETCLPQFGGNGANTDHAWFLRLLCALQRPVYGQCCVDQPS